MADRFVVVHDRRGPNPWTVVDLGEGTVVNAFASDHEADRVAADLAQFYGDPKRPKQADDVEEAGKQNPRKKDK